MESHRAICCIATHHISLPHMILCQYMTPYHSHLMCCQVNMIQLDAKNEGLRDSLFFQIFKNALLFDDLDSAMDFRRSVIHRDQQPPNLYTVDGHKVGTDGVLDPNKGRRPTNLKNIFGMQPPSKSSVYVNLVAGT